MPLLRFSLLSFHGLQVSTGFPILVPLVATLGLPSPLHHPKETHFKLAQES